MISECNQNNKESKGYRMLSVDPSLLCLTARHSNFTWVSYQKIKFFTDLFSEFFFF